jgi:hypothetical protein
VLATLVAHVALVSNRSIHMNFLKRLFGIRPDLTAAWPMLPASTPVIDLRTMNFGPLRFGASLADAQALGRPDERKGSNDQNPELFYARSGFSIDYEEGRFVFITYAIGKEEYPLPHKDLAYARPEVILADGSRRTFTAESGAEELTAVFGAPGGAEVNEDESVLTWEQGEVTIEAELNERAKLTRLNFCLTN